MKLITRSLLSTVPCLIAASLASPSHASTVYNVNFGSGSFEIAASDQYKGAATSEIGAGDVTWNNFGGTTNDTLAGAKTLADATGDNSAGVQMTITPPVTNSVDVGGNSSIGAGDEIFGGFVKTNGNSVQFNLALSGLSTTSTYDLIIYADWRWGHAGTDQRVTLTSGSGLVGTYYITGGDHDRDVLPAGLIEDTNPLEGATPASNANYARISGLSADGSGVLAFDTSGRNVPLSGFQLVEVVPEPSSLALVALGGAFMMRRRRN